MNQDNIVWERRECNKRVHPQTSPEEKKKEELSMGKAGILSSRH